MKALDWLRPLGVLSALLLGPAAGAAEDAKAPASDARPAAATGEGDVLPAMSLVDPHGAAATVASGTRLLLLTRDMDGGALVKEALAEDGRARLEAAAAVYVSDISRMPGFVRSAFALPSLRRRDYMVLLDETGEATRALPSMEGKATLLRLDGGRVAGVAFASSAAEVLAALAP